MIEQLDEKWRERASTRAFRPEPIERATLVELFAAAQRAPSWCNIQPWHVVVEPGRVEILRRRQLPDLTAPLGQQVFALAVYQRGESVEVTIGGRHV